MSTPVYAPYPLYGNGENTGNGTTPQSYTYAPGPVSIHTPTHTPGSSTRNIPTPSNPSHPPPGAHLIYIPSHQYPHTAPVQRTYTFQSGSGSTGGSSSGSGMSYYASPGSLPHLPPTQESPIKPKRRTSTTKKVNKTSGPSSAKGVVSMLPSIQEGGEHISHQGLYAQEHAQGTTMSMPVAMQPPMSSMHLLLPPAHPHHAQAPPAHRRSSSSPSVSSLPPSSSSTSASASSSSSTTRKRTRTRSLAIKETGTEGRRLVFPDPQMEVPGDVDGEINDAHEKRSGSRSRSGSDLVSPQTPTKYSGHQQYHYQQHPARGVEAEAEAEAWAAAEAEAGNEAEKKYGRSLSPRTTRAPALMTTPGGTAVIGFKEILQSDLNWLQPSSHVLSDDDQDREQGGVKEEEEEDDDDDFFFTPSKVAKTQTMSGTNLITRSADRLTRSERKQKRLDAFRTRSTSGLGSGSGVGLGLGLGDIGADTKQSMLTSLKGYGRMACGKATALKFLGLGQDSEQDGVELEVEDFKPLLDFTSTPVSRHRRIGSGGDLFTPQTTQPCSSDAIGDVHKHVHAFSKSTNEVPVSHAPEWPDDQFPWAVAEQSRKKRQEQVDAVLKLEKLDHIRKFLDLVSDDDDRDDGASESAERILLSKSNQQSQSQQQQQSQAQAQSQSPPASKSSDARKALLSIQKQGQPVFVGGQIRIRSLEQLTSHSLEDESGCLCGGTNDEGGEMICCDKCAVWYHLACCGIQNGDELEEKWFCWKCEPKNTSNIRDSPAPSALHTPRMSIHSQPTFAATDQTTRSYHAHSSDAALAPSPVFSQSGKVASILDTPAPLYNTPRLPSTSTFSKFATPRTPSTTLFKPRTVSYAEHYNVCQTPGASDSEYQKIYSTPKFEDFYGSTPTGNPSSPTPSRRPRIHSNSRHNPLFTTPTTSQNFLRGLQSGASQTTPDLDHLSSAGANYSPYPISPAYPPRLHPALSDLSATPSPMRHKRQVSFGRVAFASTSSSLRESSKPMKLDQSVGELLETTKKNQASRTLSQDDDILPAHDFD